MNTHASIYFTLLNHPYIDYPLAFLLDAGFTVYGGEQYPSPLRP